MRLRRRRRAAPQILIGACAGHGGLFAYDPADAAGWTDPGTGRPVLFCPPCAAGIDALWRRESRAIAARIGLLP